MTQIDGYTGRTEAWLAGWLQDDEQKSKHKPFALPGSTPHYTPDRPGQVNHISLDLDIHLDQCMIQGSCTITLTPIRSGITTLELDAVALDIEAITVDGVAQSFSYDGSRIEVSLQDPTVQGKPLAITIHYRVVHPQRGIYFIQPTEAYPDKPTQVWTQGEDEDSRYWFPCFDYPGQLATSEIKVTVADPYRVISNGILLETQPLENGRIRYHWRQREVHPTYLMTLAIGDFAEVVDQWQDKPVIYYVDKGREADAVRTMGKTPAMIEFFSNYFGYPYPYPKYAQVCVADFIFGGMENTSTTLLTDRCLLDERAAQDNFNSESLVAHELAHQWFGDLVVIKHWSHVWIKEGMATYAEVLWDEHTYGSDHADYHRYKDQQAYISEDRDRYRRPMVTHIYKEAIELYDCHIYQKGGCVYHMIRQALGEDLFRGSIQTFIQNNAHQTVETIDLIRAIDATTGFNLGFLFDQYVYRGGYPAFKVTYAWDADNHLAKITVSQTQDKENLFDLKIPIAFGTKDRILRCLNVRIHEAEQTFYLPLETKPDYICFDHGNHTLKTVELAYGLPELKAQLQFAPDVIARVLAAKALGKKGGTEAVNALKLALAQDPFWGVKVEVCAALGSIGSPAAFDVLIEALKDPIPQVRRAAIQALANRKTVDTYQAIKPFLDHGDISYYVEAAAAQTLGKLAGTRGDDKPDGADVITLLTEALETKAGWNEVVRNGIIAGLAELKDSDAALNLILKYTALGVSQSLRLGAIRALGTYVEGENPQILERLRELSKDPFFFTQLAVVAALSNQKTAKAIPILQSMDTEDGRISRRIQESISKVQSQSAPGTVTKELQSELDKLRKSYQDLLGRMDALEAKAKD